MLYIYRSFILHIFTY
uniref:Uncharacterized protein n=1 Tax=Lepeophtheirus salmonis TaxID=72036 RepID=A0A0K2UC02_LEPSM